MRILHLSNYYPPFYEGSTEIQCQQMVDALARRGHHQQRVLTSDFTGADSNPSSRDIFRHIQMAERNQSQNDVFRELHLHHPSPDSHTFWKLYRQERDNVEVLERHIDRFQPQLIVVWGFQGLSGSLLFNIDKSGIPCAYAVLNPWLTLWLKKEPWLDMWYHDSLANESVFKNLISGMHLHESIRKKAPFGDPHHLSLQHSFFCSKSLREVTGREGLAVQTAEVIPCGVPVEKFYRKRNYPDHLRHLLYLGRLNKDKDPLTAIKALEILHRRGHREFTLDLHGRGDASYERQLHDFIRNSILRGAVSFKVTNEEQQHVTLYSYDMLLSTSKWKEPFPLMQLKAMAAGLPVISTLEGGHAELIRDGENALAFKTGDAQDLAEKILELSSRPEVARMLTTTAYEEVREKYEIDRVATEVEAFLNRTLQPAA